jgi:hypothetical protein
MLVYFLCKYEAIIWLHVAHEIFMQTLIPPTTLHLCTALVTTTVQMFHPPVFTVCLHIAVSVAPACI